MPGNRALSIVRSTEAGDGPVFSTSKPTRPHLAVLLFMLLAYGHSSRASDALTAGDHQANVNEVTLSYRVNGKGPILVVQAPGWGIGSEYLRRTLAPLEQNFTVVYYDTRGSGHSSRPKDAKKMSTIDMADDLEALRKYLSLSTVTVLGHSHGGEIAAAFASRYPDRVRRLILVDSVPPKNPDHSSDSKLTELYDRLAKDPRFTDAIKAVREPGMPDTSEGMGKLLNRLTPMYWHDSGKSNALANLPPVETWAGAALDKADNRQPFDLLPGLEQLAVPVLIVVGKEDYIVPVFLQDEFQQNIPSARLVVFEQSGHFPWIEEPQKFFDLIRSFLRE